MKITKKQLEQIIMEEISNEMSPESEKAPGELLLDLIKEIFEIRKIDIYEVDESDFSFQVRESIQTFHDLYDALRGSIMDLHEKVDDAAKPMVSELLKKFDVNFVIRRTKPFSKGKERLPKEIIEHLLKKLKEITEYNSYYHEEDHDEYVDKATMEVFSLIVELVGEIVQLTKRLHDEVDDATKPIVEDFRNNLLLNPFKNALATINAV